ncbi:MAG: glycosyltransferase family 2 protein [Ilumatobacteraceae bacterium]
MGDGGCHDSGSGSISHVDLEVVSVLVCTRNRPKDLERLLRSLLADTSAESEIIVVDQSDAIAQLPTDILLTERVRHVQSKTRGKGAAMNEGLRMARSAYVVCTDDDCEAAPGWIGGMARLLASNPRTTLVFCRVEAPPHDQTVGYVPQYLPTRERRIRRTLASCAHRGLGAGMAIRRDVVLSLGGIDESFGPGARFGSGDDWDLEVRLLMKGWETFETDRLAITHHGFRTFAEGRVHAVRDWVALGAVASKPVRAGHPALVLMAVYVLVVDGLIPIVQDLVRLRKLQGASRVLAFCRGFAQGMSTAVDRSTMSYRQS